MLTYFYILTHSLTHSQILGNIPSEIGNLRILQELSLGRNELTGTAFFINDDDDYNLTASMMSGSIPRELGQLVELRKLWLYQNKLEGDSAFQ